MSSLDTLFHRQLAAKIADARERALESIMNIGAGDAGQAMAIFQLQRGVIAGLDTALVLCEDIEREMLSGGDNEGKGLRGQPRA